MKQSSKLYRILLAFVFILFVFSNAATVKGDDEDGSTGSTYTVYLPSVISSPDPATITGKVVEKGKGVGSIIIEALKFTDDSLLVSSAVSASDGTYQFTYLSPLEGDEFYEICYLNEEENTNRLWVWCSPMVEELASNTIVNVNTFDIQDVVLSSPASGAHITLPTTFSWVARPASKGDAYQIVLYDMNGETICSTSPFTYTDRVTITGIGNCGMSLGSEYLWGMEVYSVTSNNYLDGGFGISYYDRPIYFNNYGTSSENQSSNSTPENGIQAKRDLIYNWIKNNPKIQNLQNNLSIQTTLTSQSVIEAK